MNLVRILLTVILVVFSLKSHSQETFFWSYPGYIGVGSAFAKAQSDQKFQVNLFGQNYHNDLLGPIWGASTWYSPFPVTSREFSGWGLVGAVVHSHLVERPQVLVSPESWIYEIGLGRVMLFEAGQESFSRDMGFRGHLELVFRKTNYSAESKALGQSYLVDYDLLSRALFLKWGAGTFLWGNGLVEQKPGWLGFNLEGQIGLPLKNDHTVIFDVAVQTYLRCGFRGAKCGFDFQVFRANSVKSNETSLAVQSFYKFGPYFEWQGQSAFSFNVGLPWGFIRSAPLDTVSYNRSKKYPGINVGVSYGL